MIVADTVVYWIWLQRAIGPGSSEVPKLLEAFNTAKAVWEADRLTLQKAGITAKRTLDALGRKSLDAAEKQAQRCARMGWMLTPEDERYPEPLRQIFSPPLVLYGKGELPSFDEEDIPAIGIVGTRRSTTYGVRTTAALAAGLAAVGCPIISGGARGIDRAAHEGALYASGRTVIVQACGLNVEYPFQNRDLRRDVLENGGAIVTEFLPDTRALSGNFHIRNRLISGLSRGLCVVEAPAISGALITARTAREQGRDVFVVPGRVTEEQNDGSHTLIREGAILVTRPSQILQEYPSLSDERVLKSADRGQAAYHEWRERGSRTPTKIVSESTAESVSTPEEVCGEPAPCPTYASPAAQAVYAALVGEKPLTMDELSIKIGLTSAEMFSALTELELYGCVDNQAGKRYAISKIQKG